MSGESVNYIVLAIPVFFLLIGVELLAVCVSRRDYYRLNDALNDLSCGILDQLLEIFMKTVLFAGYVFVFERLRLATLPAQEWWLWAACFLGVDFLYYWFHRLSHEVNAFWAAHVVHHQSEEYNLAVALRQGALQSWFSWIFYVPLALLGFPPLVFLACTSFNTLYQFWIHTRLIGRLGPLEWLLNTPSNHRVHHGRNPKYIDRNHGGTLIVWDRLFGSYQAEQDEPVYGITRPLLSFNPLWANVHYWAELFGLAARTRRPADRLRAFVKPPGWRPQDLGGYQSAPEVDRASYRKWDVWTPPVVRLYAAGQFAIALLAAAVLLNLQDRLASPGGGLTSRRGRPGGGGRVSRGPGLGALVRSGAAAGQRGVRHRLRPLRRARPGSPGRRPLGGRRKLGVRPDRGRNETRAARAGPGGRGAAGA